MNKDNDQENKPDALADIPLKRKRGHGRGRPRKHPKYFLNQGGNSETLRDQNPYHAENTRIPPMYEEVNQPHQVDPSNGVNSVVGQAVYGVIEAAFDAGYLLTVKIGNSDTTLRGAVFKPGHYVPVSEENDVAPNVQMIRKSYISFPSEINEQYFNIHRNVTSHPFNELSAANKVKRAPRASNIGGSKGRYVQSVATLSASPLMTRGNVVPVVLQPASLPNGASFSNQPSLLASQPAHLVTSKGKQVSEAANRSNAGTPTNQLPAIGNQIFSTQPRSNSQTILKDIKSDSVSYNRLSAEASKETEARSMALPGMHFEKLLTEVIKRVQVPLQPMDAQGGNLLAKDSGNNLEDDQPLSVEPLKTVQPAKFSSLVKPLENLRTGKMTELLQVNLNQASWTEEPAAGSVLGDKEMNDSNKHSQVSSA